MTGQRNIVPIYCGTLPILGGAEDVPDLARLGDVVSNCSTFGKTCFTDKAAALKNAIWPTWRAMLHWVYRRENMAGTQYRRHTFQAAGKQLHLYHLFGFHPTKKINLLLNISSRMFSPTWLLASKYGNLQPGWFHMQRLQPPCLAVFLHVCTCFYNSIPHTYLHLLPSIESHFRIVAWHRNPRQPEQNPWDKEFCHLTFLRSHWYSPPFTALSF